MYISPDYKPENVYKRYISIEHSTNTPILGETNKKHLWIHIREMTEEEINKYSAEIAEAKRIKYFFPNWVAVS